MSGTALEECVPLSAVLDSTRVTSAAVPVRADEDLRELLTLDTLRYRRECHTGTDSGARRFQP